MKRAFPSRPAGGGSHYSASIFAALLSSVEISIWTDGDGVLSADPRLVLDAKALEELSYNQAMELAYFGAEVLHPVTMTPAVRSEIPIYIRTRSTRLARERGFIHLTDNIVQFQTARYNDNPLVVQGPGAGPEVTAGGVFADLLR